MSVPTGAPAAHIRYVASITLLAALWLAMLLWGAGPLDQWGYEALYAGGNPVAVGFARFFTALGEPTVLIGAGLALALWLWFAGRRRLTIALVAIILIGRGLAELQKLTIGRPRPSLDPHLVVVKTSSFPSGHATASMIFYLTLALTFASGTRWEWLAAAGAILLSLMIGTSRVMLGVHWPSDVIGGWAFGLLWVLLTLRIAERWVKE